jgi:hypothetical protein
LILSLNPFFPFGSAIMDYVGLYSIIPSVYVTIFIIYIIISRYESIRKFVLKGQAKATSFLVRKNEQDMRADLLIFLMISITIAFCIDVIITKISQQDFVTIIMRYVPPLRELEELTPISPTENLNSTANFLKTPELKAENLKLIIGIFFGPTVGALILFLLRQLRYRVRATDKDPGARILLLFLIVTAFILLSDISYDFSTGLKSLKNLSLFSYYSELNENGTSNFIYTHDKILLYGTGNVIRYALTFLINPYYYISIISIWIFDWYLFSRLWT